MILLSFGAGPGPLRTRRPRACPRALFDPARLLAGGECLRCSEQAVPRRRCGPPSLGGGRDTLVAGIMASWRGQEAVEFATLEWVDWFNHRRLLEVTGKVAKAQLGHSTGSSGGGFMPKLFGVNRAERIRKADRIRLFKQRRAPMRKASSMQRRCKVLPWGTLQYSVASQAAMALFKLNFTRRIGE